MNRILFDTNVILDVFLNRTPFVASSKEALKLGLSGYYDAYVFSSSVKDIYYILRRFEVDPTERKSQIRNLCERFGLLSLMGRDILDALDSDVCDYEDAIIDSVCHRENIDLIITRNVKDFAFSKVKAVTPDEFLKRMQTL